MDPTHLNDEELEYELNIRGVQAVSDRRVATKYLRKDLNDEIKGLKHLNISKLSPFKGKRVIENLDQIVSGLVKELAGAFHRKAKIRVTF